MCFSRKASQAGGSGLWDGHLFHLRVCCLKCVIKVLGWGSWPQVRRRHHVWGLVHRGKVTWWWWPWECCCSQRLRRWRGWNSMVVEGRWEVWVIKWHLQFGGRCSVTAALRWGHSIGRGAGTANLRGRWGRRVYIFLVATHGIIQWGRLLWLGFLKHVYAFPCAVHVFRELQRPVLFQFARAGLDNHVVVLQLPRTTPGLSRTKLGLRSWFAHAAVATSPGLSLLTTKHWYNDQSLHVLQVLGFRCSQPNTGTTTKVYMQWSDHTRSAHSGWKSMKSSAHSTTFLLTSER